MNFFITNHICITVLLLFCMGCGFTGEDQKPSFEDSEQGMSEFSTREVNEYKNSKAEKLYHKGHYYWDQGNYKKARKALKSALEIEPGHTRTLNQLGLVEEDAGNPELAIAYLRKALTPDSLNESGRPKNAVTNLAWTYHYNKAYKASMKLFDFVINNFAIADPEYNVVVGAAYLGKTHNYIDLKNCKQAEKVLEKARNRLKHVKNSGPQLKRAKKLVKDCPYDLEDLEMDGK